MEIKCWEIIYTNKDSLDRITTTLLAKTIEQAYERALDKAESNGCKDWEYYSIKAYEIGTMPKPRYSEIHKQKIRGDDCCPFWRIKGNGTCAAKAPWEGKRPCTACEDGSNCPVFDKR